MHIECDDAILPTITASLVAPPLGACKIVMSGYWKTTKSAIVELNDFFYSVMMYLYKIEWLKSSCIFFY